MAGRSQRTKAVASAPAAGRRSGGRCAWSHPKARKHTLSEFRNRRPCQGLESREQGGEMAAAQVRPAAGAEGTGGKARRQEWRVWGWWRKRHEGIKGKQRRSEEAERRGREQPEGPGEARVPAENRHVAWAQGARGHRECAGGRWLPPHGAQTARRSASHPFCSPHMASVPLGALSAGERRENPQKSPK